LKFDTEFNVLLAETARKNNPNKFKNGKWVYIKR
jgi:hypothetical protein